MEYPSGRPEGPTTEENGDDVGWMDGEIRHLVRDEPPAAAYIDPVASADMHPARRPARPGSAEPRHRRSAGSGQPRDLTPDHRAGPGANLLGGGSVQPLMPVDATPSMIWRCATKNMMIIGIVVMTLAAMMISQCYSPPNPKASTIDFRPRGMVKVSGSRR